MKIKRMTIKGRERRREFIGLIMYIIRSFLHYPANPQKIINFTKTTKNTKKEKSRATRNRALSRLQVPSERKRIKIWKERTTSEGSIDFNKKDIRGIGSDNIQASINN